MKIENNRLIEMNEKQAMIFGLLWDYCLNIEVDCSDAVRELLAEFDQAQQKFDGESEELRKLERDYINYISEVI